MFDVPFETTSIIYLAATSTLIAALVLLFLILNRVRRASRRVRLQKVKKISISQNVMRFMMTTLWLTVSLGFLFLAAFVQSFNTFTKEELVAEIVCRQLEEEPGTMLLQLTPVSAATREKTQGYVLNGDQWALEGDVLIWDNWLNFMGLHTMYKLTRVKGRYLNIEAERDKSKTIYSLVGNEEDPTWRWLYKYGYKLRFVDAVYGNTVYTYPADNRIYQVFVTTSGYGVKVKPGNS